MEYNPERHHRHSIRLQGYNYAEAGAYFVTVCIEQHECLLGEIVDGQMLLDDWGQIASEIWEQVADHWPSVEIDAFVVMPNHLHGIIIITEGGAEKEGGGTPPLQEVKPPQKPTLGAIMAFWKYQSSKRINEARQTPGMRLWQRNFYEWIIRNEQMLERARNYIANNPGRWDDDADNPINVLPL